MKSLATWLYRYLRPKQSLETQVQKMELPKLEFVAERSFLWRSDPIFIMQNLPWLLNFPLFIEENTNKVIRFPITKLSGITNGKQEYGVEYPTLYDFSLKLHDEYKWGNRIGFRTEEDFVKNTSNIQTNKQHISANDDGIFTLYHVTWNNSYYIDNIDGAHHLAAIYRQCKDQDRQYKIVCRVRKLYPNYDRLMMISREPRLITKISTAESLTQAMNSFSKSSFRKASYKQIGSTRVLLTLSEEDWIKEVILSSIKKFHDKRTAFNVSRYIQKILK